MTGENIFRELGGLDPELILKGAPMENKKPNTIKKLTLIAACLTLILFVTATLSPIIAELINGGTHGEGTVGHTTPYYADFEISIVENGQIRKKTVNLPMDYNIIDAIYLKDVSYMRIKTVILSCSMPKKWLRRIRFSNMSFNLTLGNPLTFTSYEGMDPEVPGATYPTTRTVSFGINLGI